MCRDGTSGLAWTCLDVKRADLSEFAENREALGEFLEVSPVRPSKDEKWASKLFNTRGF